MTPDTSGPTLRAPLAYYDPDSSCWKTSQGMWPLDWPTLSESCPTSGMTRRGLLFALPTPAPRTYAPDCSSLLPTPEAKLSDSGPDYARATRQGSGGDDLTTTVHKRLLPTPMSRDYRTGYEPGAGAPNRGGAAPLNDVVRLLPTPVAMDAVGARNATSGRQEGSRHHAGTTLTDALWLAGGHTGPRSSDGNESSAGRHPTQPSSGGTDSLDSLPLSSNG